MLVEKLDVLVTANIIDEDTKNYILSVADFLCNEMKIANVTKVEVFLIHLAMAESRRKKNEVLDAEMEDIVHQEIHNHSQFGEMKEKWGQLLDYTGEREFSESELSFIYLHLLNVLEGEQNVS